MSCVFWITLWVLAAGKKHAACLLIDILLSWSSQSLLLYLTCTGLPRYTAAFTIVSHCTLACDVIFFTWALGFLNGTHLDGRSYVYTLRALMSRCSSSLSVSHRGPCDLVLASLIMFSSLLCVDSLQTLVGAWWARASACLLADPTMSGRRNWSETGSTHRLCATYCCWTTLSRRSKSA